MLSLRQLGLDAAVTKDQVGFATGLILKTNDNKAFKRIFKKCK